MSASDHAVNAIADELRLDDGQRLGWEMLRAWQRRLVELLEREMEAVEAEIEGTT